VGSGDPEALFDKVLYFAQTCYMRHPTILLSLIYEVLTG